MKKLLTLLSIACLTSGLANSIDNVINTKITNTNTNNSDKKFIKVNGINQEVNKVVTDSNQTTFYALSDKVLYTSHDGINFVKTATLTPPQPSWKLYVTDIISYKNILLVCTNFGLYKLDTNNNFKPIELPYFASIGHFAIDKNNVLYITINAASWGKKASFFTTTDAINFVGHQPQGMTNTTQIYINPHSGAIYLDTIFMSGVYWISHDNGKTFQKVASHSESGQWISLVANADDSIVWLGSVSGGIYKSVNHGEFNLIPNTQNIRFYDMKIDKDSNLYLAGDKLYKFDNHENLIPVTGMEQYSNDILIKNDGTLYIANEFGLYKSN